MGVARAEVVRRGVDGHWEEAFEQLTGDVEEEQQGAVMQKVGERGGERKDMVPDGKGRVRLDFVIPSRGLIGFHGDASSEELLRMAGLREAQSLLVSVGRDDTTVLIVLTGPVLLRTLRRAARRAAFVGSGT